MSNSGTASRQKPDQKPKAGGSQKKKHTTPKPQNPLGKNHGDREIQNCNSKYRKWVRLPLFFAFSLVAGFNVHYNARTRRQKKFGGLLRARRA